MTHKEYNGWTNYETWNVALWIDNDEGSHNYWEEQADARLETNDGDKDEATNELANQLSEEIRAEAPDLGSSCYADLLNAALSEVNWYEIAEGKINEAAERRGEEQAEEN